jgi:fructose-bisphosphate aldolase, class II
VSVEGELGTLGGIEDGVGSGEIGAIPPTWGVPIEEIQQGIRHGVRKINVDTDSRLAITGAIRKVFAERRGEFDPRSYLGPARAEMKRVVAERMVQFGQAGHAALSA